MRLQVCDQSFTGLKASRQHHIGFDQSAALWVRLRHHGRVGDGGVFHQTVLDLTRPNTVASGFEHIVGAALVPEVSVRIAHGQIAGAAPITRELGLRGTRIFPIAQKENRVWLAMLVEAMQSHIPWHAIGTLVAFFVDHCHAVAWVALAHAAWLGGPTGVVSMRDRGLSTATRPFHRAIAHDVIDFGLTKHLVDRHTQLLLAISEHRIANRFARTHHGLELKLELAARRGVGLHHGLECSGK